jgi:hypothetical protein
MIAYATAQLFGVSISENISKPIDFLALLVMIAQMLLIFLPVGITVTNLENLDNLISAVKHSMLKYFSIKCAKCETTFFYLIPKEDEIKDHVVCYLDDTSPKKRKNKERN